MSAPATPIPDCTGALIAGGRAARLGGVAKGLLRLDGEPIAVRTLRLFDQLFETALVVASEDGPYASLGAPMIADVIPGKGAPGGLHAALQASRTGWVFAAGCDMPFIDPAGMRRLAALRPGADAVLVRWQGRIEPLFAFWSRRCLGPLEALLRRGDASFHALAREVAARVVPEQEWRAFDPAGRCFENVNTPEDLARLGLEAP